MGGSTSSEIEGVSTTDTPVRVKGRDSELGRLTSAYDQAAAARGRCYLVSGDPGIGKTTLVEGLADVARSRGAAVVWGRCWEAGGAPAYWPWVQALRAALTLPGAEKDLERVRAFVDVVATLLPEVAGPGGTERKPREDGDRERFALFDAISRVIQALASSRPLVLVLEDLHAADSSSLNLLRFISKDLRDSRCLVVGTYREREANADPVTAGLLAEVTREGDSMVLEGLPTDAIQEILENAAGVPASNSLVSSLDQITEGNPFYATEIMRLLLRENRVEARLDLTRKAIPVPTNVIDTVLKRVRRLEPKVQHLLDVAAVIGREFSLEPVQLAGELDISETHSLLSQAEAENVVRLTGPGTYIFDHGLIREALYGSMPDRKRATLHGRIAVALEEKGVDAGGENLAEIAHHYLRAALDDARPPFAFAARAAQRALNVFAYEQAIDLFEEALRLAPIVSATPEEKSELLCGLGEALLKSARVTDAKETLREAAEEARRVGASQLQSKAVITYGFAPVEGGIVDQVLIDLAKDALEAVGEEPSRERAMLLVRWAHELVFSGKKEDATLRDRLSSEAVVMIREVGERRDLGRVLRNRFSVILAPDRLDECMAVAEEILEIGLELRDPEMQLLGRMRRAIVLMLWGKTGDLDVEFREVSRLAAETKQALHLSPAMFFKACLTGMRSDVASAVRDSDAAMAVGSEVPNAMGAHLLQRCVLAWQVNGGAEYEAFMRAAIEQRPGIRRTWRAAVAATLARTGRTDEANELLKRTIEGLPETPIDSAYMGLLYCATETARFLDDPPDLEPLYEALFPFRDQHIVQTMVAPVAYFSCVEACLALLASIGGRWDVAEEHFAAALREHSRVGARTQLAWSQAGLAEMLLRRGDPADAQRVEGLVLEARRSAESLGLALLVSYLDSLAALRDVITDTSSASMVREGEYVTIEWGDEVTRLKWSKGLAHLARLLAAPGQEIHVLEMASASAVPSRAIDVEMSLAGDDAGPILDAQAKAAYRERVRGLQEDIEEAESFNDPARASRAREELEFIAEQLSGAVGLGGRDRKAASNAERARVNITKRIKTAIEKIAAGAPKLGRHLEATVKTGTFLSYDNRLEQTLEWEIRLYPPKD